MVITQPQVAEDMTVAEGRLGDAGWWIRYKLDQLEGREAGQTQARTWWGQEGPYGTPMGWVREIARMEADQGHPYTRGSLIRGTVHHGGGEAERRKKLETYLLDQLQRMRGSRAAEGGHLYKYDWRGIKFPNQQHPRDGATHRLRTVKLHNLRGERSKSPILGGKYRCVASSCLTAAMREPDVPSHMM